MCGICGLYTSSGSLPDAEGDMARMLMAIRHRGPDAQGAHVESQVALGAARLAIIDLAGGDQPIYSEDRAICLVYNGEIYNYREHQRRLSSRGHVLASESDSEILAHLYEDHGIDFVSQLDGMFAFALWDTRQQALYLVRDRFGVKPLYYRWSEGTLVFGSEVKALLASGRVSPSLDLGALVELLTFQNVISNRSLFEGVRLLPAGSILRLDATGARTSSYWKAEPRPDRRAKGPEAVALTSERFSQAVTNQLVADVEVASYLSGGLDTGAIAAVAVDELPRLTTFSTGFDVSSAEGMEAGFDERADAAALAGLLGTHHHELLLDAQDMEMVVPRLVRHIEEPRMSFSYPNYLTAGMASRWVKVALSGTGGDELFGGYPWRYSMANEADPIERYFAFWNRLLNAAELKEALSDRILVDLDLDRPRVIFDRYLAESEGLPVLDRMLHFEFCTFLRGLLLIEDKLSMAHSLEVRVPFLDNELVDFAMTVPADVKLRGGQSKRLFREAMIGMLPENVRNRDKTGFTPPQAAWFRHEQIGYTERLLLSDRAQGRGLWRADFLRRTLEEHRAGKKDRRLLLWTMICLEWWHRIFEDGEYIS
jgi:asparagine synthase (glutamine-hydrolysing)